MIFRKSAQVITRFVGHPAVETVLLRPRRVFVSADRIEHAVPRDRYCNLPALGVLLDDELGRLVHLIELRVLKLAQMPTDLIQKALSQNSGRQWRNEQIFVESNFALISGAPWLPIVFPEHGLDRKSV